MPNTAETIAPAAASLLDEVTQIVAHVIEKDPAEIAATSSLPDEHDVTSLLGLEILVALQKRYKVKIPESLMQEMTTVQGIAEMLEKHVGSAA